MARRKRRGGRRKSKSIPIAPIAPLAAVVLTEYSSSGLSKAMMYDVLYKTTGVTADGKLRVDVAMPFWLATGAGIIVHKVANKTINKYIRKATFGYLSL